MDHRGLRNNTLVSLSTKQHSFVNFTFIYALIYNRDPSLALPVLQALNIINASGNDQGPISVYMYVHVTN